MASLTQEQQKAWSFAFEKAKEAGLNNDEASDTASNWAKETDFGKNPLPFRYQLGPQRPQKPSSDIEQKVQKATHAYDPTLRAVIFSGQENPLGIGGMNKGQRAKYKSYLSLGYPEDTAGRMVRASTYDNSLGRHPLGEAADVWFEDIAGNRLPETRGSQKKVDQIAFNHVQATGGNWGRGGPGYMSLGTAHLDTAPLSRFAPGPHWGDRSIGSRLMYQQAKGLYDYGRTDPSMVPVPRFRDGWSPADKPELIGPPVPPPVGSEKARNDAYRDVRKTMLQAGIGGLDGRLAEQSRSGYERYGRPHLNFGLSPASERAGQTEALNGTRSGSQVAVPAIPVPRPKPSFHAPVSEPISETDSARSHRKPVDPLQDIMDFLARQKQEKGLSPPH